MINKILVVEDDASIVNLLSEVFCDPEEYETYHALDGLEALNAIQEHNPDIVLLDILIPKINGYDVCESIKSDPATSHIKVIMTSGMAQNFDKLKAREVGADAFIAKPFSINELIEKVEGLLSDG